MPQQYLAGKPLVVYVAEGERSTFCTLVNQLGQTSDRKHWQMSLAPRGREPFKAQLHVESARNHSGSIEALWIGVYNMIREQHPAVQLAQPLKSKESQIEETMPMPALPQSLDGLQVLVVDDEADSRELITAILESHGISVRAVASAAAALEELKRFQPDVLVSDIRMPGGDGYSLIRQVRALEALQEGHIPAAAMTAYLDEDEEKSLQAGFEGHLYKLAQPSEWVEMVTQLAGQTSSPTH